MKISEARHRYLFTTRIELPREEGEDDTDYVVLREPTLEETQLFSEDGKKNIDTLKSLFPKCLVEHSFVNDDLTPTKNEEVYNMLRESSSLYIEIINAWFKSIPFQSRLKKQPK
jgi:hypothetical protein